MNLDELVAAIRQASHDPSAQKLSDLLLTWKDDNRDVRELGSDFDHLIGNTWIDSKAEYQKIYSLWAQFRENAIRGIGSMTTNERLYFFSLFSRWDSAHTEEEKKMIYAKIGFIPSSLNY